MGRDDDGGWHGRWYALLLRAYPQDFRSEFGAQLEQFFRDRLRHEREARRRFGIVRLWVATLGDLVRSAGREWFPRHKPRNLDVRLRSRDRRNSMRMISETAADIRYAGRTLRRDPMFAVVAIVTLGLAIGASTAIFSVVDGVLLEPLRYRDSERLALIYTDLPRIGLFKLHSSGPEVADYRRQSQLFEQVAYVESAQNSLTLTGGGEARQVTALAVSWDLPSMLGVTPQLGRLFDPQEGTPNGPRAVLVQFDFWIQHFGGDTSLVGSRIELDGESYTVAGVLPPDLQLDLPAETNVPPRADFWLPSRVEIETLDRHTHYLTPVARLAQGVSVDRAHAEMQTVATGLRDLYYDRSGLELHVVGWHADLVAKARPTLMALFGAVSFVLLIACANIANLTFVRGSARQKELALRAALGAGRFRIVRQILTESVLVAAAGTIIGVGLAAMGLDLLVALRPSNLPRVNTITIDGTVLAFTAIICVVTIVLFGLLPATRIAGTRSRMTLTESGLRYTASRAHQHVRGALVVSEVALSLVLLVGSGLLMRTFWSLYQVDPGFDAKQVLTFRISLPPSAYGPNDSPIFFEQLEDRLRAVPGVRGVGSVSVLPLSGIRGWSGTTRFEGVNGSEAGIADFETDRRIITAGYFPAMGARLVEGRYFDERDVASVTRVTIIDNTLARRVWPGVSAVGKRFTWGVNSSNPVYFEVIGVVDHLRHHDLSQEGREQTYFPEGQFRFSGMTVVVRADRDPLSLADDVRRVVASLDPDVPPYAFETMEGYVALAMAPARFHLILLGVFSAVGLVLAVVGIYGVVSYGVGLRARELAIRSALGAPRRVIISSVLRGGLFITVVGIVIGVAGALLITRFIQSLLFGVTATDPLTYVGVAATVALVATLASLIPAWRAGAIDPVDTLRTGT